VAGKLPKNQTSGRSRVVGLRLTSQTYIESSVVRAYHLGHGDYVDAAAMCEPVPVTGLEIGQSWNGAQLVADAFVQSALRKRGVLDGFRSRATRAVLEPHAIDPYMDDRAYPWRRLDPQDRNGGRAFPQAGFVNPRLAWAVAFDFKWRRVSELFGVCFWIIWRKTRQFVPITRLSRAASTTSTETW
jgi:hypothetical protein